MCSLAHAADHNVVAVQCKCPTERDGEVRSVLMHREQARLDMLQLLTSYDSGRDFLLGRQHAAEHSKLWLQLVDRCALQCMMPLHK